MVLWSQRKSRRMPGLVMHWQLLQISTMTASLIYWWEPHWRTNTGGPSMSIMDIAFTSFTVINRYKSLSYSCRLTEADFQSNLFLLLLISASPILTAYSRVIDFPLPAVFWPQRECSVGLGWRWANRFGSGSAGQCCNAEVGWRSGGAKGRDRFYFVALRGNKSRHHMNGSAVAS